MPLPRLMLAPPRLSLTVMDAPAGPEATFTTPPKPELISSVCAKVPTFSCASTMLMPVSVAGAVMSKVPPPARVRMLVPVPALMMSPALSWPDLARMRSLPAPVSVSAPEVKV